MKEDEPCELPELPDDPREQERAIEVLVQTATQRDAACLVRALEQWFPALVAQSPPPSNLAELREWWELIGYRAHRFEFGTDEFVVLPQLPRPLGAKRRAAFEPLLCAPGDPESCATESRAFLALAERQLWELSELERAKENLEQNKKSSEERCAREALAGGSYSSWRFCVTGLVPTRLVIPLEAFRMPEKGVLRTHLSGYWEPCFQTSAYSLKSTFVLTRVDCWLRASKEHLIRYRVGRLDPKAVQRAALFIAVSNALQTSPVYAQTFAVPRGLKDEGGFGFGRGRGRWSDALELHYELHGVLTDVQKDSLYAQHESEPERRLIVQLLLGLDAASAPSCATPSDKEELSELFGQVAKQDENLDQVIESVACPR